MVLVDGVTPGLLSGLLPAVAADLRRVLGDADGTATPLTTAIPQDDRRALASQRQERASAAIVKKLGVPDGAKAAVIAALAEATPGPLLVITPAPNRAQSLLDDVQAWLPATWDRPLLPFPPRETVPYEHLRGDGVAVHARLRVLASLTAGGRPLIVTDVQALSQRTLQPGAALPLLRTGDRLAVEPFLAALDAAGYRAQAVVDEPGTFARRGGIVDVFPPTADLPLRIELFGDAIESLRQFDPATQRSVGLVQEATLHAATEAIVDDEARAFAASLRDAVAGMDRRPQGGVAMSEFARDLEQIAAGGLPANLTFWTPFLVRGALWEHLPPHALIVWDEVEDARRHLQELDDLAAHTREALEERGEIPAGLPLPHSPCDDLMAALQPLRPRLDLHRFATDAAAGGAHRLAFSPVDAYGGRMRTLMDDLQRSAAAGQRVTLVSLQAPRLIELFREHGLPVDAVDGLAQPPVAGVVTVVRGSVPQGWRIPTAGADGAEQVLITDTEIFGFAKQRRARPRRRRSHTTFLEDLRPGDYVVHTEHGIGRFAGISRERIGQREHEYVELRYAENDRLLVPTDQLHRLQRYVGPSEHAPSLTRLGTQQWQRAKQRVRAAVRELAQDLLQLYAARQVLPGIAQPPDSPWQMELEAAFPYVETPDQTDAVRDVKADMERPRPMDRIVVGDVGYGKTEVAVRAAFKTVLGGNQVALLVPTTVLAQQHFTTFQERMAAFPVRIEMLSRFRSQAEQKLILEELAGGKIDIVIGTHRLLQKDVEFKSLGLLVIDEEQRFGVANKETLKRMRREVDVLTLSATPIPRTLHMALSGIRDMSTIETPPEERLPITTYVMESDDEIVREAIMREVERSGQVYFVHNRVQSIEMTARWLRELAPEAHILVGHGQMPEAKLEQVMVDFVAGEADVLVCTTIIESGLDIPNVNTIIIHQAQRLGLAQLYQLRGRVGRGAAQAYAYLLYDRHQALTETAQKRLQTIFDATELGAGFQIALRDLEIRGTGNLLGAEQSGHIGAIGFELYTQLLAESVEQLRATEEGRAPQPLRRGPAVSLDLPLVAHIPESYIEDVNLRLSVYQQLAAIETPAEADAMTSDLRDRFGPPPPPLTTLLRTVRLRTLAARLGAESLQREEDTIVLRLAEGLSFDSETRRAALPDGVADGVEVTRRTLRLDLRGSEPEWLDRLESALDGLTAERNRAGKPLTAATPA
ncbi:MAG: transcription-repair coupling factor [Dehalococcoidia bacterium]